MKFTLVIRCGILAVAATTCGLLLSTGPAKAASTYDASAAAALRLSAVSGSLDDLLYLTSQVGYSAHVEAKSNGLQDRKAITVPINKSEKPAPSFGSLFSNGKDLTDVFLTLSTGRQFLPELIATAGGAKAVADGEATPSAGSGGRFKVAANGFATDLVESANSRSRLDLFVAFQNNSDSDMELQWQVVYSLHDEAHADPRGSAFAQSGIQAARGTFESGGRVFEPNIFGDRLAACGFNHPECSLAEMPPDISGVEALFSQTLAAGAIAFFNVELVAEGNATVVPVPAALPLFLSGLVGLGVMARRRRRQNIA